MICRESRFGSGNKDSGPAKPCNISKLDVLRFDFVNRSDFSNECGDLKAEGETDSAGEGEGEYAMLVDRDGGRGNRCNALSNECNFACWCRMLCLMVEIWFRI